MKFQFNSKTEIDFVRVLAVRDKLVQHFGTSDFIGGEMQFADVPLSGLLKINLQGLTLGSLSVESFLPAGNKSFQQIREIYQQLEPIVSRRHVFFTGFEFCAAISPSKKKEILSLMSLVGHNCFLRFLSYHPTHRKEIIQRLIDSAHLPANITQAGDNWFIKSALGSNVEPSMAGSDGSNPMALKWQASQEISERFSTVERILVALANSEKGIKCSWKADTVMGGGSAEELIAILNATNLTIPKGILSFSYVLKELEGLERMRILLGPKAKLSAQAAAFHWLEDDRGQLWVDSKGNGYQIQFHLDDGDRIKELQDYLGLEFDSGKESFL